MWMQWYSSNTSWTYELKMKIVYSDFYWKVMSNPKVKKVEVLLKMRRSECQTIAIEMLDHTKSRNQINKFHRKIRTQLTKIICFSEFKKLISYYRTLINYSFKCTVKNAVCMLNFWCNNLVMDNQCEIMKVWQSLNNIIKLF